LNIGDKRNFRTPQKYSGILKKNLTVDIYQISYKILTGTHLSGVRTTFLRFENIALTTCSSVSNDTSTFGVIRGTNWTSHASTYNKNK